MAGAEQLNHSDRERLTFPEYLNRLLSGAPFDTTPRRAELLRYLVEKSLAGEGERLNEYAIALEVFRKPESFDQRIDSSVRSEISRLRKMVANYYEGAGATDPWRITFPARGYVPQISEWLEPERAAEPAPRKHQPSPTRRPWAALAAVAAAVALLAIAWSFFRTTAPTAPASTAPASGTASRNVPPPEARALFLKGQYYREHRTDGTLRQAVDAYTQAIVADSNYAEAYAGLAESYDLMPEYASMPQEDAFSRAIAAANKAIELDPSNAVAHRALGFGLFWSQTDIPRAFAEFETAIQLAPNEAETHHWYATALNAAYRSADATREINTAQQLSPGSRSILADQAWIRYCSGDKKAAAKLQELETLEPDFSSPAEFLARIDLDEQNDSGYLEQLGRIAAINNDPDTQELVKAAQEGWTSGGAKGMLKAMQQVQQRAFTTGKTDGYDLARTAALLGEQEKAMEYLEKAFAAKDLFVLDALRPDWAPAMNGYAPFETFRARVRKRFDISAA